MFKEGNDAVTDKDDASCPACADGLYQESTSHSKTVCKQCKVNGINEINPQTPGKRWISLSECKNLKVCTKGQYTVGHRMCVVHSTAQSCKIPEVKCELCSAEKAIPHSISSAATALLGTPNPNKLHDACKFCEFGWGTSTDVLNAQKKCASTCGDNKLAHAADNSPAWAKDGREECDPGNNKNYVGCTQSCKLADGYYWTWQKGLSSGERPKPAKVAPTRQRTEYAAATSRAR